MVINLGLPLLEISLQSSVALPLEVLFVGVGWQSIIVAHSSRRPRRRKIGHTV